MSEFVERVNQREEELLKELDHPDLIILSQMIKKSPFAEKYLKKDTFEYYLLANQQYSIYPVEQNGITPNITDILNKDGLKLLFLIKIKVAKDDFKDAIKKYKVEFSNSGRWHDNKSSPYSKEYNTCGVSTTLNSWKNRVVSGKSEKHNQFITTSACVFIDEDEGWCFTASGSLYRLKK